MDSKHGAVLKVVGLWFSIIYTDIYYAPPLIGGALLGVCDVFV